MGLLDLRSQGLGSGQEYSLIDSTIFTLIRLRPSEGRGKARKISGTAGRIAGRVDSILSPRYYLQVRHDSFAIASFSSVIK